MLRFRAPRIDRLESIRAEPVVYKTAKASFKSCPAAMEINSGASSPLEQPAVFSCGRIRYPRKYFAVRRPPSFAINNRGSADFFPRFASRRFERCRNLLGGPESHCVQVYARSNLTRKTTVPSGPCNLSRNAPSRIASEELWGCSIITISCE